MGPRLPAAASLLPVPTTRPARRGLHELVGAVDGHEVLGADPGGMLAHERDHRRGLPPAPRFFFARAQRQGQLPQAGRLPRPVRSLTNLDVAHQRRQQALGHEPARDELHGRSVDGAAHAEVAAHGHAALRARAPAQADAGLGRGLLVVRAHARGHCARDGTGGQRVEANVLADLPVQDDFRGLAGTGVAHLDLCYADRGRPGVEDGVLPGTRSAQPSRKS
jgi:hypothetical protein